MEAPLFNGNQARQECLQGRRWPVWGAFPKTVAVVVLLVLALPACAAQRPLIIVNDLQNCVALERGELVKHGNLLLYDVQLKVPESIGHCGCKSAVASYRVFDGERPVRFERLVLKESRQAYLLIDSDAGSL